MLVANAVVKKMGQHGLIIEDCGQIDGACKLVVIIYIQ